MISKPDKIPSHILRIYEQASTASTVSAEASMILARKCIEAMIRDHFKLEADNLAGLVTALKSRIGSGALPYEPTDQQLSFIELVRQIGNDSAHLGVKSNHSLYISDDIVQSVLGEMKSLLDQWYR